MAAIHLSILNKTLCGIVGTYVESEATPGRTLAVTKLERKATCKRCLKIMARAKR
jgi:hypothetical protein